MFSFLRCLPLAEVPACIARPKITITGSIKDNLTLGQKFTDFQNTGLGKRVWAEVVRQVQAEGLALSVPVPLPSQEG